MERDRLTELEEAALESAKIARKALDTAYGKPVNFEPPIAAGILAAAIFNKLTEKPEDIVPPPGEHVIA